MIININMRVHIAESRDVGLDFYSVQKIPHALTHFFNGVNNITNVCTILYKYIYYSFYF